MQSGRLENLIYPLDQKFELTITTPAGRLLDITYIPNATFEVTVRKPNEEVDDGGLVYEEKYFPGKNAFDGEPEDGVWELGRKEQLENL